MSHQLHHITHYQEYLNKTILYSELHLIRLKWISTTAHQATQAPVLGAAIQNHFLNDNVNRVHVQLAHAEEENRAVPQGKLGCLPKQRNQIHL